MIFALKPVTKHIIWGGERLSADFGIGEKGEKIAEAWELTCRPDGDNIIDGGNCDGMPLSEFIKLHPDSLGEKWDGRRFPLLIKLIDACSDLSIQVHPDDEYAKAHTSDSGKTEMWYIIDAEPGAKIIYGTKRKYTRAELSEAIAAGKLEEMMNYVPVHSGETYFIPSGMVHAICAGILIAEIQQNSDITYRVYDYNRRQKDGSLRQLHVAEALDVIERFDAEKVCCEYPEGTLASCKYFTVKKLTVSGKNTVTAGKDSFLHLLCTDGEGLVMCGNEKLRIKKGGSVFVTAASGEISIVSDCATVILSEM